MVPAGARLIVNFLICAVPVAPGWAQLPLSAQIDVLAVFLIAKRDYFDLTLNNDVTRSFCAHPVAYSNVMLPNFGDKYT